MHIDCLTVKVLAEKRYAYTLSYCFLENTAVYIDCLTARVTAAFSFCERRGWVMRYVYTDLYVINIVGFLLSASKHESKLRF